MRGIEMRAMGRVTSGVLAVGQLVIATCLALAPSLAGRYIFIVLPLALALAGWSGSALGGLGIRQRLVGAAGCPVLAAGVVLLADKWPLGSALVVAGGGATLLLTLIYCTLPSSYLGREVPGRLTIVVLLALSIGLSLLAGRSVGGEDTIAALPLFAAPAAAGATALLVLAVVPRTREAKRLAHTGSLK